MIYQCENLATCVVSLKSKKDMLYFLLTNRERSVQSKMRKAIAAGIRDTHPTAENLITEMRLIHALKKRYRIWRFKDSP